MKAKHMKELAQIKDFDEERLKQKHVLWMTHTYQRQKYVQEVCK